jgi:hypothetical protein
MYENITTAYYRNMQPDDVTHAGSEGWNDAPVPGWGVNPARVGPPVLGALEAESPIVSAIERAAKSSVFTTRPVPTPFVPYPVHREVPGVYFDEVASTNTAPWGIFPHQRAYGAYYEDQPLRPVSGLGAYYAEAPLRAVSGLGETPLTTTATPAGARIAVGGVMLAITIGFAIGVPIALGGLGYWFGGKIAPTPASKKSYQWGGAAANIAFPVLGPAALALVAAMQKGDVRSNPRKKRKKSPKRRARRRAR